MPAFKQDWTFYPSGEMGFGIAEGDSNRCYMWLPYPFLPEKQAQFWQKLILMSQTTKCGKPPLLALPFFPYAREDRPVEREEGQLDPALTAICNLLKSCCVLTADLHSYSAHMGQVNILGALDKQDLFKEFFFEDFSVDVLYKDYESAQKQLRKILELEPDEEVVFVAPDLGAAKEVGILAAKYHAQVIYFNKKRDSDGHIVCQEQLNKPTGSNRFHYLVIDDLCDGGGTFLGISDLLFDNSNPRQKNSSLWATHGLFTKGLRELQHAFWKIFTTDSVEKTHVGADQLMKHFHVFPLQRLFDRMAGAIDEEYLPSGNR